MPCESPKKKVLKELSPPIQPSNGTAYRMWALEAFLASHYTFDLSRSFDMLRTTRTYPL